MFDKFNDYWESTVLFFPMDWDPKCHFPYETSTIRHESRESL